MRARAHVVGEEWEVEFRGASGAREGPQGRLRGERRSHKERVGNEQLEIFPGQGDSAWEMWWAGVL